MLDRQVWCILVPESITTSDYWTNRQRWRMTYEIFPTAVEAIATCALKSEYFLLSPGLGFATCLDTIPLNAVNIYDDLKIINCYMCTRIDHR